MKNSVQHYAILIGLLLVSSCKKEEVTPIPTEATSTLSCMVDSVDFVIEGYRAYAEKNSNYNIVIYGENPKILGTEYIRLDIPSNANKGTYTFNNTYGGVYNCPGLCDSQFYSVYCSTATGMGNGTVTIEDIANSHVKGTFQFTAYGSTSTGLLVKTTVSEGKFNVVFK